LSATRIPPYVLAVETSQTTHVTLCYVRREGKVLLQMKAAGRFGAGRWNGPGGKLLPGEPATDGVIREVEEETGLRIINPAPHGAVAFGFGQPEQFRLIAHVFTATEFNGVPRNAGEGRLRWFPDRKLPYDSMWSDDIYWVPIVLDGGWVDGLCVFHERTEELLSCRLATGWDQVAGAHL
jgi:8-oxo-dGTP diphosphatase